MWCISKFMQEEKIILHTSFRITSRNNFILVVNPPKLRVFEGVGDSRPEAELTGESRIPSLKWTIEGLEGCL